MGERSERDFASASGATATQKRSLRNVRPPAAAAADAFLALADAARAGWGTSGRGVVAAEARCCLRAGRGRVGAGGGCGEGKRRDGSGLRGRFGALRGFEGGAGRFVKFTARANVPYRAF